MNKKISESLKSKMGFHEVLLHAGVNIKEIIHLHTLEKTINAKLQKDRYQIKEELQSQGTSFGIKTKRHYPLLTLVA